MSFSLRNTRAPFSDGGGHIEAQSVSAAKVTSPNVHATNSLVLSESASQGAPAGGTGRLWVRNAASNVLVFTDGAGTDTELPHGTLIKIGKNAGENGQTHAVIIGGGETEAYAPYSSQQDAIVIGACSNSPSGNAYTGPRVTGPGGIAIGSSAYYGTTAHSYSIAIGGGDFYSARATGSRTVAIGQESKATFPNAIAIGSNAYAEYHNCVAVGWQAEASGLQSIAIGPSAYSSGQRAIAIGQSYARNFRDICIGFRSAADSEDAICIGYLATVPAVSNSSIVIGANATVSASSANAIAIGAGAEAGAAGVAIGAGATAASNQLAINVGTNEVVTDFQVTASAPGAAGAFFTITFDGGVTMYRVPLVLEP